MASTVESDPVLRWFRDAVGQSLGTRLRQILLFGSRARGDASDTSDYDVLLVVDRVDRDIARRIDEIVGHVLLQLGAVVSVFAISEDDRAKRRYSPLLINAARQGVSI